MSAFNWNEVVTVAATIFFILDPLGNIPVFHAILAHLPTKAKIRVIARELLFALAILMIFLIAGVKILRFLGLSQPSLNIAGSILLFVIALRMVFPQSGFQDDEAVDDPYIVPLAMPLIAGPSTIAVLLLLSSSQPERLVEWIVSLLIAWSGATLILVASPVILSRLGDRALHAITRLMGMLLILISVQMFLNGITQYATEVLRMKP
jgi:multiple antibiotic resistance protein